MALPGEAHQTAPARVWLEQNEGEATWVGIELHEGRNRQVRRMFEAVGHPVLRLRRVRVGPQALGALPPGESRLLTPAEVERLRHAVGDAAAQSAAPAAPAGRRYDEMKHENAGQRRGGEKR